MSNKELLLHEIEQLPDTLVEQILDFARFLKQKRTKESLEPMLLSESSLRKDWLREEEDEAWQDL